MSRCYACCQENCGYRQCECSCHQEESVVDKKPKAATPKKNGRAKPVKRVAKSKPPAVTVALKDINRVCEACGKVDSSVTKHNYTTVNYQGPCGDSFCYASCDLSSCKPVTARVCASCFVKKAVPIAD